MSLFSGLRQKKKKKKTYHTDREAKSSRTVPIFVLEWSPNPLRSSLAHSNWGDTLLMRRVVVGIGGWWSCAQPGVKPPPDSAMSLPHSRFFLSAGFFLTLKESSRCCCKGSDFSLASPGFCTNPVHQIIRKGWSQIPELDFPSATIFFFFQVCLSYIFTQKCFYHPAFPPQVVKVFPQESNKFWVSRALFLPATSDAVFSSSGQKCWATAVRPQSSLTQVTAHFLFLLLWSVFFAGAPCYRSFSCPRG